MEFIWKTTMILLLLTLVFIFKDAEAIKCWECRSDADPKCSDPFDNATFAIADCNHKTLSFLPDAKSTMCRKIRQKVNGVWTYIRSCAFLGEPGIQNDERFCLMRTGTYNIFMEYCTCNSKDGCNGSPSLNITYMLLLLPALGLPFVFRIMR